MRVIGITGLAGSGKTTVARYLVDQYGYTRIRFADPLKAMLREFGLTDDEVDGGSKEIPNHDLLEGKTPREAMQTLGTEWGREHIGPDVWVNAWRKRIERIGATLVVADDVRFPNEVEAIYRYGGIIVHITRPGKNLDGKLAGHISEQHALPHDVHLINDGALQDLLHKTDFRLIRGWPESRAA